MEKSEYGKKRQMSIVLTSDLQIEFCNILLLNWAESGRPSTGFPTQRCLVDVRNIVFYTTLGRTPAGIPVSHMIRLSVEILST